MNTPITTVGWEAPLVACKPSRFLRVLLTLAAAGAVSLGARPAEAQQGRDQTRAASSAPTVQEFVIVKRLPRTKQRAAAQRRHQESVLAKGRRESRKSAPAVAPER